MHNVLNIKWKWKQQRVAMPAHISRVLSLILSLGYCLWRTPPTSQTHGDMRFSYAIITPMCKWVCECVCMLFCDGVVSCRVYYCANSVPGIGFVSTKTVTRIKWNELMNQSKSVADFIHINNHLHSHIKYILWCEKYICQYRLDCQSIVYHSVSVFFFAVCKQENK